MKRSDLKSRHGYEYAVSATYKPVRRIPIQEEAVSIEKDAAVLLKMVQAISDVVLILDLRVNQYTYCNRGEIAQHKSSDCLGAGFEYFFRRMPAAHGDVIKREILPVLLTHFEAECEAGNAQETEASYSAQLIHPDGEPHWYRFTLRVLTTDPQGRPKLLLQILKEIEAIKKDPCIDFSIARSTSESSTEILIKKRYLSGTASNVLSERESQILSLISMGYTSVEIAEKLFISQHTVRTHRKNILRKTFCKGTAELAAFALGSKIEQ